MAHVPQIRSSLNRYKLSFLALAILGTVSTFYFTNTEVVDFSGENDSRELLGWKELKQLKPAWQKLMQKKKDKLRAKKKREKENRLKRYYAARNKVYERREETQANLAARKKIVLCLSYPFGGVDQIINAAEYATGESMATMYADEAYDENFDLVPQTTTPRWLNMRQLPKGPWLSNDVLPPPTTERVLVKTYCGGYCEHEGNHRGPLRCRKDYEYFFGLGDIAEFTDMCISGKKRGPFLNKLYGKSFVDGAVAVLRDPVELVLARYRDYAMKEKYEYTTSGLYQYCAWNDRFFDEVSNMKSMEDMTRVKPYFEEGVTPPPCFSEFYRIIKWQSNAVDVVLRKKGLIFYWEDLTNSKYLDNAVNQIIDYMGMERADEARDYPPFENPDLSTVSFEDEDLVKIKSWMSAAYPDIGRGEIQKYLEI